MTGLQEAVPPDGRANLKNLISAGGARVVAVWLAAMLLLPFLAQSRIDLT
jgi:hypothetical protein